jgi:hypothetical protein
VIVAQSGGTSPLEKGIQRFARFQPIFADKKCPVYKPEAYE